jgi:glutamate N-acetyltransferase/amino-acid N-acetyltransferase
MVVRAAEKLGISERRVLVASTGVVGVPLPMERIGEGMEKIVLSREGGHDMARAMMTTDTVPKEMAVLVRDAGSEYTVAGVAKGSGMIHPDMATLLCFLTTDIRVGPAFLSRALKRSVDVSFNMVTIDGDTSPSDSVLLLANGLAGGGAISESNSARRTFQLALDIVCIELARRIARDGEGATRLIEISVLGARNRKEAQLAARTIAGSPLVKSAVYGCDPNWGRIAVALGRSGAAVEESRLNLYFGDTCVFEAGQPRKFDEKRVREILGTEEVRIAVDMNLGRGKAMAWGCDLTPEYVTINSAYTT